MTNDNGWGFDENDGPQDNGVRQYIKNLESQLKELKTEREAEKADAQRAIKSTTFESLGISASVATLYQGDANPDAIKSWVTDMRTAFGGGVPSPQGNDNNQTQQPVLDTSAQEQYQRLSEAGHGQQAGSSIDDKVARAAQAQTIDELRAIWNN